MTTTPFRPIIRTQADLEDAWRHLMQPLGFSTSSIWLMLICDDDRPLPQLTEIADAEAPPAGRERAGFVDLLGTIIATIPDARLAFLRSRPGRGGVDDDDRAWAEMLYAAARTAGAPCEIVHVATDDTVEPIPLDSLGLRSA